MEKVLLLYCERRRMMHNKVLKSFALLTETVKQLRALLAPWQNIRRERRIIR